MEGDRSIEVGLYFCLGLLVAKTVALEAITSVMYSVQHTTLKITIKTILLK